VVHQAHIANYVQCLFSDVFCFLRIFLLIMTIKNFILAVCWSMFCLSRCEISFMESDSLLSLEIISLIYCFMDSPTAPNSLLYPLLVILPITQFPFIVGKQIYLSFRWSLYLWSYTNGFEFTEDLDVCVCFLSSCASQCPQFGGLCHGLFPPPPHADKNTNLRTWFLRLCGIVESGVKCTG
jgi:hypothetical protein